MSASVSARPQFVPQDLELLLGLSFIPVLGVLIAIGLVTLGFGAILLSVFEPWRDSSELPPSARAAQPRSPSTGDSGDSRAPQLS